MSTDVVKLYALSTCIHCRHTIEFLDENNIPYDLTFVDKTEGTERDQVISDIRKHNPRVSFPTMICGDGSVIVGFRPDLIKEKLGNV